MNKVRIIVIGVLVSLIVPIIRVFSFLIDSWEMEDESKTWLSTEVEHITHNVGQIHIAYWSAYTGLNFLRDFLVGVVIYTIVIFLCEVAIRKMNLNRSR